MRDPRRALPPRGDGRSAASTPSLVSTARRGGAYGPGSVHARKPIAMCVVDAARGAPADGGCGGAHVTPASAWRPPGASRDDGPTAGQGVSVARVRVRPTGEAAGGLCMSRPCVAVGATRSVVGHEDLRSV